MSNYDFEIIRFITESNRIEGIYREPYSEEISEFNRFMNLEKIDIKELINFVRVYQPNAVLRDRHGLDVYIGNHKPIKGSPLVRTKLEKLLVHIKLSDPYKFHQDYENLHPFTDGNGRSGRMLWAWKVRDISLGFLHSWYYQSLNNNRR